MSTDTIRGDLYSRLSSQAQAEGFVPVPVSLLRDATLSSRDVCLWMYVALTGAGGPARPAVVRAEAMMHVSRYRASLRVLVARGLVSEGDGALTLGEVPSGAFVRVPAVLLMYRSDLGLSWDGLRLMCIQAGLWGHPDLVAAGRLPHVSGAQVAALLGVTRRQGCRIMAGLPGLPQVVRELERHLRSDLGVVAPQAQAQAQAQAQLSEVDSYWGDPIGGQGLVETLAAEARACQPAPVAPAPVAPAPVVDLASIARSVLSELAKLPESQRDRAQSLAARAQAGQSLTAGQRLALLRDAVQLAGARWSPSQTETGLAAVLTQAAPPSRPRPQVSGLKAEVMARTEYGLDLSPLALERLAYGCPDMDAVRVELAALAANPATPRVVAPVEVAPAAWVSPERMQALLAD